uniref:Secreted protein n=1 Tax=Ascaris lumbricoides TaxID=6252 RepID=A0A0M3I2S5_ASCLU
MYVTLKTFTNSATSLIVRTVLSLTALVSLLITETTRHYGIVTGIILYQQPNLRLKMRVLY